MKKGQKTFLWFMVAWAVYQAATSLVHAVTPTLIKERGFHDWIFGAYMAAMSLSNFLLAPFWGKLCNYISSKFMIAFGGFGYIVGQMIFGFSRSEGELIAGRLFAGIFFGGVGVAAINYVINTSSDEQRSSNLLITATVQSVSSSVGYFIGGLFGEISVIAPFMAQAGFVLLAAFLFMIVCTKNDGEKEKAPPAKVMIKDSNPFAVFLSSRNFMTGMLVVLFGVIAIASFGQSAYEQTFNYYLKDHFNVSTSYNGTIKAVTAVVGLTVNSTICMMIMKKTDIKKSIIYVLSLCTVAIFTSFFFKELIPFTIVNVIFCALNSVRMPVQQALSAQIAKSKGNESNVIMGFHQSMNAIGTVTGSLSAGFAYERTSALSFFLGGLTFTIATVLAVIYFRGSKKEVPAAAQE